MRAPRPAVHTSPDTAACSNWETPGLNGYPASSCSDGLRGGTGGTGCTGGSGALTWCFYRAGPPATWCSSPWVVPASRRMPKPPTGAAHACTSAIEADPRLRPLLLEPALFPRARASRRAAVQAFLTVRATADGLICDAVARRLCGDPRPQRRVGAFPQLLDEGRLQRLQRLVAAYHRVVDIDGTAAFLLVLREAPTTTARTISIRRALRAIPLYIDRIAVDGTPVTWKPRTLRRRALLYDDLPSIRADPGPPQLTCEFRFLIPVSSCVLFREFDARCGFGEVGTQWLGGAGRNRCRCNQARRRTGGATAQQNRASVSSRSNNRSAGWPGARHRQLSTLP